MRRNSWQDGVLGTNCPIPSKWNWTYQFQVKDQIGSYFYFPSLGFQRASGGFGPFVINNRNIIPIPFAQPDGDIVILIGDWFTQTHTVSNSLGFAFLYFWIILLIFFDNIFFIILYIFVMGFVLIGFFYTCISYI